MPKPNPARRQGRQILVAVGRAFADAIGAEPAASREGERGVLLVAVLALERRRDGRRDRRP